MNNKILICEWSRRHRVLEFDPESGRRLPVPVDRPVPAETFGFHARLGRLDVIVYRQSERWWLRANGLQFPLDDQRTNIEVRKKWPWVFAALTTLDGRIEIREFAPFRLLFAKMDPTYDHLDVTSDFFLAWLVERIDHVRRGVRV